MLIGICRHFPLPPAIDRPRRTPCQPFLTLSPIRSGVGKSYNSLLVESPLARRRPCTPHGCHRQPPQGQTSRLPRSEEHTSELQSRLHLVCRLLLEKKKKQPPDEDYRTINTLDTNNNDHRF